MSGKNKVKIDISEENWENVDFQELDFKNVDWTTLNPDQRAILRKMSTKRKKKRKMEKKLEKNEKRMERMKEIKVERERVKITWEERFSAEKSFGDLPVMMSENDNRPVDIVPLKYLNPSMKGEKIVVRARIHKVQSWGKNMAFFILRDDRYTTQVVVGRSQSVSIMCIQFAKNLTCESIVEVHGEVVCVDKPTNTTQKDIEILASRIYCISASRKCPFQIEDLSRPGDPHPSRNNKFMLEIPHHLRLDHRYLDLRVPAHKSIFRISSKICELIRLYLSSKEFIEVHTPKFVPDPKYENESSSFRINNYKFGRDQEPKKAFLTHSPKRFHRFCLMGDFERVFEIKPVFRVDNFYSARHLNQFTSINFEMRIMNHYHEVLDMLEGIFVHIFDFLKQDRGAMEEIGEIKKMYPSETLFEYESRDRENKIVRISYLEAIRMLKESTRGQNSFMHNVYNENSKDRKEIMRMDVMGELTLGRLVKEKYGTDIFILCKIPKSQVGWDAMPCPRDKLLSNSFRVYMKGMDVSSGCQRIHDLRILEEENMYNFQHVDLQQSLQFGAWAHGGACIGLERFVMLYLGVHNIRKCSLFPRDPHRLNP